jgi:hypothetical protein
MHKHIFVNLMLILNPTPPTQRYKYMFVSNSDNLGATMDLTLLSWFAHSGAPFAMEV